MPFIQENGAVTPVYQLVTALTDEQLITGSYAEGLTVPQALAVSRQLVDESQAGYYAAIATQFHVDYYLYGEVGPWTDGTDGVHAEALQIPDVATSQRYLEFIEGRRDTVVDQRDLVGRRSDADLPRDHAAGGVAGAFDDAGARHLRRRHGDRRGRGRRSGLGAAVRRQRPHDARHHAHPSGQRRRPRVSVLYAVPTPTLTIGDLTVTEGHTGTTRCNVPVSLSAPSANTITVNFAGRARHGDYSRLTISDAGHADHSRRSRPPRRSGQPSSATWQSSRTRRSA